MPVGMNDTGSVGQRGNPSHHTGFSPATACCHSEISGSQLLFCGNGVKEHACIMAHVAVMLIVVRSNLLLFFYRQF